MTLNTKIILTSIITALVFSFIGVKLFSNNNSSLGLGVYDKVMKSGVIKACYVVYPPAVIKDPNTGEIKGIFVDALNKAGENMGLKVDWVAEVGWGEQIEALNSGKCDIIGSDSWTNSTRAKSAEFLQPLYYSAINAYVRADDTRFDSDIKIANNKNYKIVTLDGETSQSIASKEFPNAQTLELPQLTDVSQLLLNVVSGKGDMTFQEASTYFQYAKNNPGKLKNVSPDKPIVVYGNVMIVKKGEFALKSTIDNALIELLGNGFIDQSINKYEKEYPGGFYRVTAPYTVPSNN